MTSASKYGLGP